MLEKIKELKEKFEGKDCLIITAGPSLENTCKKRLKELAERKVVIAVKQAYYFVPEIVDIHVINDNNYECYDYKKAKRNLKIILLKSPSILSFTPKSNAYIKFIIKKESCSWEKSLVHKNNFEDYEICENSLERPWGPGIMYEICIYLPVFFNSNNVIFVSWDLGSNGTNIINRFRENNGFVKHIHNYLISNFPHFFNNFYIKVENIFRIIFYFIGFKVKMGLPSATKNEAIKIAESTLLLSNYYNSKGINHFVISDASMLCDNFERI